MSRLIHKLLPLETLLQKQFRTGEMSLLHSIRFQGDVCPNHKTKPESGPVFHNWQILLRRGSAAEQWDAGGQDWAALVELWKGVFAELWLPLWSWQVGLFLCLSQSCQKVLRVVTAFFKFLTFGVLTREVHTSTSFLWPGSVRYGQWIVRVHNVWPST